MSKADVIFGLHTVLAVLERAPERVLELYVTETRGDERLKAIIALAKQHDVAIRMSKKDQLDELTQRAAHQGVVAKARPAAVWDENELSRFLDSLEGPAFLLVLDGVTDPHNLGACMRTADAAGVHAVIVPKDRAAGITPVARKVASGAAEVLPFVQVTNLARTLRDLQERGIWIYGTALDETAKTLYDTDLRGSVAIVMGAEGTGIRRLTREHCDGLIYIPMYGSVGSMNVSVATGICLFEAVRQRSLH
ncbi:MAG TPA: 23S rRNA (guanosine(2251)-2'-O)-methyltransferase RlmB [Pseudomonadales bacterium]|nr:23S rRNA (guanosine(2251)-2'-O)-methyltransferase RlmB [Pseudomonadales bacterium]